MITMIPREKLEPHPDNPRKDLGDLTDLAASIARQGILQNLTVVPSAQHEGMYRIVIGHRRFAASGKIGIPELPCVIDEKMGYTEQLAVMMSENIQRNDLTIAERVGGVQMMMDFGMDAFEIAQSTGIGKSTVSRYAKLAALPREKVREAEHRGATLWQLEEIVKIKDEDLRQEAMEKAGTNDFQLVMNRVRMARLREERKPILIQRMREFATRIDERDYRVHGMVTMFWYTNTTVLKDAAEFKPRKGTKYVFLVGEHNIDLLEVRTEETDEETRKKREARERLDARIDREKQLAMQFEQMRREWMSEKMSIHNREDAAMRFVLWTLTKPEYLSGAIIGGTFDTAFLQDREEKPEQTTSSIIVSATEIERFPEKSLLYGMVLVAFDRVSQGDMTLIDRYTGRIKEPKYRKTVENLYTFMRGLGYPVSSEEEAWLYGEHECFEV